MLKSKEPSQRSEYNLETEFDIKGVCRCGAGAGRIHTCVGKTEGPESQVGGGVRHTTKAVLDGVDSLTHKQLAKVKLKFTKNSIRVSSHVETIKRTNTHILCKHMFKRSSNRNNLRAKWYF